MTENKITKKKQFQLMIGILEENPPVAKGMLFAVNANFGREQYNDVWSDITGTLNSAGPPTRTTKQWQKVWSDLKRKVKTKLQENRNELNSTGGGPNKLHILSKYEEAVANLLSLERTTDHSGPSFGLASQPSPGPSTENYGYSSDSENEENAETEAAEIVDLPVATPVTPRRQTPKRQTPKAYRQKLLEDQSNYMKELVENSRESLNIQREGLHLQQEKLQLKKEYVVRIEKQRVEELQFQLQMLEYRKMKLELQRSNSDI